MSSELRERGKRGRNDAATPTQASSERPSATSPTAAEDRPSVRQPGKRHEHVVGRTPDGTVFEIPHTEDVLTGLFDPRLPKSSLDLVTLSLLGTQLLLWLWLPRHISKVFFMVSFAVWRLSYNAGLGYILTKQSKQRWIVGTVKRKAWLDENKHPKISGWIRRQVTIKLGPDYDFDAHPVEYNVWVLFRHMVDIILLNDFLSYFLFGISFLTAPNWSDGKALMLYLLRWAAGLTLLVFNLWVKTDAHRIITDLAWYWADAFFLSLQDLVFDGVFEMAPHPMYSVGYAGYYGLSIIVGSETVLFVSLAAHACQFAFLVFFENPHIERTYGERKPLAMRTPFRSREVSVAEGLGDPKTLKKERADSQSSASSFALGAHLHSTIGTPVDSDVESGEETETDNEARRYSKSRHFSTGSLTSDAEADHVTPRPRGFDPVTGGRPSQPADAHEKGPILQSRHDLDNYYFRHDTVILRNFDVWRATDFAFGLAILYILAAFAMPYASRGIQLAAILANAMAWRIFHTFVLGRVLQLQSEKKWMVRHFLKHYHYEGIGFTAVEEAFNNWKAIYNISLCMVYSSFFLLALRCYDGKLTTEILRHVLGCLLIALHVWTAKAIYDVLGRFGWFYGDFFIQNRGAPLQLYYTGIYRHVNNPERIMGGAAFFGLALISGSKLVGVMAVFSVLSHFWFLSCVENPHMQRLYGNAVRKDAGVTKTFKGVASKQTQRAPPQVKKAVKEFQGTLERVYDDTSLAVEEFLRRCKGREDCLSTPWIAIHSMQLSSVVFTAAPRFSDYVENTKVLLKEQGERLLITRVADVASLDTSDYSLVLEESEILKGSSGTSEEVIDSAVRKYALGEAITVNWTAPAACTRKDWIGLYRLGSNKSRLVTRVRSQGRWLGIYPDQWDGDVSLADDNASGSAGKDAPIKRGKLVYTDKRLFWKTGKYEFRYHHNGMHNVMAVSEPFEIVAERPARLDDYKSVYDTLLPLVTRCLNNDASVVPESAFGLLPTPPDESVKAKARGERTDPDDFAIYTTEQAERIATVLEETTGLELTSEVVMAEANVAKLAHLVVESKHLLSPFRPASPASPAAA